jgi:probable HAF family extracellular repeat protein
MRRYLLSAVLSLSVLLSPLVAAQDASYTFTTIDVPFSDATGTAAVGINNNGQIVGNYADQSRAHGFLYAAGAFTLLEVPFSGVIATEALGINDRGQIVGSYLDPGGTNPGQGGFLYAAGVFTLQDVPFSGAIGASPLGINDQGQIVGDYRDSSGQHGFLATPDRRR